MDRDTITDRLEQVIRTVQLGHQTGILSVECGAGETFEEGAIAFLNEQVVWAQAGGRDPTAALHWLKSWGVCRFAFLPSTPEQVIALVPHSQTASTEPSVRVVEADTLPLAALPPPGNASQEPDRASTPSARILYRDEPLEAGLAIIDRLGLSRTYRHAFLLADGLHTELDLARTMGREPADLEPILSQLEHVGLIHQESMNHEP